MTDEKEKLLNGIKNKVIGEILDTSNAYGYWKFSSTMLVCNEFIVNKKYLIRRCSTTGSFYFYYNKGGWVFIFYIKKSREPLLYSMIVEKIDAVVKQRHDDIIRSIGVSSEIQNI
jgi:hypothetical protein